jgi:hypothetical protein
LLRSKQHPYTHFPWHIHTEEVTSHNLDGASSNFWSINWTTHSGSAQWCNQIWNLGSELNLSMYANEPPNPTTLNLCDAHVTSPSVLLCKCTAAIEYKRARTTSTAWVANRQCLVGINC